MNQIGKLRIRSLPNGMFTRKIQALDSISIIALGNDHHWIALDNLCHLLSDYDVTIYSTNEYVSELDRLGCTYYRKHKLKIKDDAETKSQFLDRIRSEVEKSDVLILETLRTEFEWFAEKRLNVPVTLFIHCLNWWAFPDKRWPLYRILQDIEGVRSKLRIFKSIPSISRKSIKHRQKVLMNVDALVFHDPGMVDYYYKNWNAPFHRIAVMPYTYYNPDVFSGIHGNGSESVRSENGAIRFIVPGSIYQSRRNYDLILSSFKKVAKQNDVNIELIFPGPLFRYESSYGKMLTELFDRINDSFANLRIHYNCGRETTSMEEYDSHMKSADVIVSQMPLNGIKMFKYYDEKYCESTACHHADLVRFCKPGIFPESFKMIPELAPIVDVYSNENDLIRLILKHTDRQFIADRQSEAERISRMYFSKAPIMKRFLEQLMGEKSAHLETASIRAR